MFHLKQVLFDLLTGLFITAIVYVHHYTMKCVLSSRQYEAIL